jgi:PAS domain S-box-containing protein
MQNKPRESGENNFLALLNFIVDPAVIVDEKGRILLVNNAFEDSTGLGEEVIGTVFLEMSILLPESKAILWENLKKRMQGLPVQPYEITFTDKNGETRSVEVNAKKISYTGQHVDLVIFRDVTRRKKNLAKLKEYSEKMEALVDEKAREIKENAEKLRLIFDSSPDAITVLDLNGKIIDCNQAKVRMHGFSSKDELIGKSLFELVSPKDRQKALLCMSEIVKTGSSKNIEYAFLAKDGKEFPVECTAGLLKDAAGNPIGYISITKGITERKKAEDELKLERDKLEAVTENIGAGLIIISRDYKVLWANDFIKRDRGDAEGKLCYVALHSLDAVCTNCSIKKIFGNGVTIDAHEYCSVTINGKPY